MRLSGPVKLTVGCHSHCNALLEATFLALVSGHFVNDAFSLILTSVGWVEVLLDCPPEETLGSRQAHAQERLEETAQNQLRQIKTRLRYLATFTGNAAIVIACGFVPAHYT